jgi:DNA topoisomerase-1
MNIVVVESPAKAKTINKYLGKDFKVLASYGHIRDLPAKNGSVQPEEGFKMEWELTKGSPKHLKEIENALKEGDTLYLASDPDREGEAIAWHVYEVLKNKKALKNVSVQRIVFHEITKRAVLEALENPRALNQELIDAYLARRTLDYLVGFNLSPVLWRKLPGSKSAGRVQSVALRLITEREAEIERFKSQEYWSITADFMPAHKKGFKAKLIVLKGEKLQKFSLQNQQEADLSVQEVAQHSYHIGKIEKKQVKKNPQPPFTTSTLQQEASRKLGFGATRTMRIAQNLYEGVDLEGDRIGIITYMRTDSVHMGTEAVGTCREYIKTLFGASYLPESPRAYKSKVKNAQEAHEAIRPTDFSRTPESLKGILDATELKLYALIWKRALASQMENALLDQVIVDVVSKDQKNIFRASGSTIAFDGFLKLYEEGQDDEDIEKNDFLLPPLKEGEDVHLEKVTPAQHFTQPPPRYTEASLVKKMEELGIGRPSTYAAVMQVLQSREYVRLEKKALIPEERGRLVSTFLESFFRQYVEYNFTADLENQLDEISKGSLQWKEVLKDFWKEFLGAIDQTKDLKISDVLDILDKELADHFFPETSANSNPRKCPECHEGKLHLKIGKYGAFIGCERYPECKYVKKIGNNETSEKAEDETTANSEEYPKNLGQDPKTKLPISLRKGPYGMYVQLGEAEGKNKPKRAALPKSISPQSLTFEAAIQLLNLPRVLGTHPQTGEEISTSVGRFGPYVKHGSAFVSLKSGDVLTVTLEEALDMIEKSGKITSSKKKKE